MPEVVQMPVQGAAMAAVAAVVSALETMAFISPMPAEDGQFPATLPEALHVSIGFSGPARGRLQLLASPDLGRAIACNLLGLEPNDPGINARGRDALKEIANVACGLLLESLQSEALAGGSIRFQMMLPELADADDAAQQTFRAAGATVLDADSSLLAVRLEME